MKCVEYRAFGATMKLVVLVWLTATVFFAIGKLTEEGWLYVTIGGVFAWVLRDGATKFSEAYRDARNPS